MLPRPEFFGSTVISDKGQVVIPSEARKALGFEKGDRLVVMGMNGEAVLLVKADRIEKMVSEMAAGALAIGQMLDDTKGQGND